MRNSCFILCLLIFIAGGLSSCTKVQMASDASPKEILPCSHSSLEHHPATSPTYDECGNVEYWQCNGCGMRFSDSGAATPFTGYVYLLPTRFVDMGAAMELYSTKSTVATVAAIVCVIGLAASVGGLITSVTSLIENTDDIAGKIEELSRMEDKNVEQIKLLEELNDELCEKIPELNELLTETRDAAQELVLQMNTTQQLMDAAESLEDAVLLAILKSEHDIEVAKLMDTRYKQLQNLKFSCVSALRAINEYLDNSRSELAAARTRTDSLAVFGNVRDDIIRVAGSWGSEKAGYPSQTSTLLAEFISMTYDDNTSFLDMFTESAADVLPFDHDVVVVKKLFAERELCIMALGTCLSTCYYRNCCGTGNKYAVKTAEAMEKKLTQCRELRDTFYEKWEDESNAAPWHCNVSGRYFQSDAIWLDVKNFVSNNTMTMKSNVMVSSSKPLSTFYGVSEGDALTELEWELIRKDYLLLNSEEAEDLNALLFSTDRPGMVFKDTAPSDYARTVSNIAFSIPYSSGEYFSLDEDDLYYTCLGEDMTTRRHIVEYSVVNGTPNPNGTNTFYYVGSNGRTRFYTVRTSTAN